MFFLLLFSGRIRSFAAADSKLHHQISWNVAENELWMGGTRDCLTEVCVFCFLLCLFICFDCCLWEIKCRNRLNFLFQVCWSYWIKLDLKWLLFLWSCGFCWDCNLLEHLGFWKYCAGELVAVEYYCVMMMMMMLFLFLRDEFEVWELTCWSCFTVVFVAVVVAVAKKKKKEKNKKSFCS